MRKLLLFLLTCATCPAATITYVQGATNSTATATAIGTMGSSVGVGDLMVFFSKTAASSAPTVAVATAGTATCAWESIISHQFLGSQAAYELDYCIVTVAGTLATTVTWSGASGTYTDIAVAEYNSSTGWTGQIVNAVSYPNGTPGTTCASPGTGLTPANFLALGVCGTFNAGQSWAGTVGAFTNRPGASLTTTGFYDTVTTAPTNVSISMTINTDIAIGCIVVFAPNAAYAKGQPVVF